MSVSEVPPDLLAAVRPEVVDAVETARGDHAVGDEIGIHIYALSAEGEGERVVEECACVGVGEAVEIPVGLVVALALCSLSD